MAQQDFENFKQRLKIWKDSHSNEYNEFVAELNRPDLTGYEKITNLMNTLMPQFQEIFAEQFTQQILCDTPNYDIPMFDILNLEKLFKDSRILPTLIEFENSENDSSIPAMLSWLFLGQGFERMFEIGEGFRNSPLTDFPIKAGVVSIENALVSNSIIGGHRTIENWENHSEWMKMLKGENVLDVIINDIKNKPECKKNESTAFENLLLIDSKKKKSVLLKKIEEYLNQKKTRGQKIAWMIIALKENGYIFENTDTSIIFKALEKQFQRKIKGKSGVYRYCKIENKEIFQKEIENTIKLFKVD